MSQIKKTMAILIVALLTITLSEWLQKDNRISIPLYKKRGFIIGNNWDMEDFREVSFLSYKRGV